MSEGIELHDSELSAISVENGMTTVFFSPAIVYRPSEIYSPTGSSVWLQPATLTFDVATGTVWTADPPVWVSAGVLRIGDVIHDILIPLSGSFEGLVELSMTLVTAERLIIRGRRVTIQLLGEPSYLEEFLPEEGTTGKSVTTCK